MKSFTEIQIQRRKIYIRGNRTTVNKAKAKMWYEKAAEQGYSEAVSKLST